MNNIIINKKELLRPEDPKYYKYFINQISKNEIEIFRKQILNGKTLPDIHFSYESSAKTLVRIILLSRVMTIEEIESWYGECCRAYFLEQPEQERFPVYSKKYHKKIIGDNGIHRFKKIDEGVSALIKTIRKVYFNFKKQTGFDPDLIRELKETINELKPLNELKACFENRYKLKPGFFTFLESQIGSVLTSGELENYFKSMALQLQQKLGMGDMINLSVADLESYIFGKRVNLCPSKFINSNNKPVQLMASFYQGIFPFITVSLYLPEHRQSIYRFCGFSEKESLYWEEVYQHNYHQKESEAGSLNNSNISVFQLREKEVELIQESVRKIIPRYQKSRTLPELTELKEVLIKEEPELKELLNEAKYSNSFKRKTINEILNSQINELKKYLFKTQFKEEFKLSSDIWRVYRNTRNGYFYHTLDFTPVKNKQLREELKIIALEDIRISLGKERFADRMPVVIKIISTLEKRYQIESFSDIIRDHLLALYHYYRLHENKSVSTISKCNIFLKFAFETLASKKDKYRNLQNIPELIRFSYKDYSIKTKVIPSSVIDLLLSHLDDLPIQIALMLELFLESGWRFKEIAELKTSCFIEDSENPDFIKMTGTLSKVRRSHQKNGLSERISCYITGELYGKIKNFIDTTEVVRENYNIKTLFYSINNGQVSTISNSTFNYMVKALIIRYNICDSKGRLWQFSTRQTRATVATDLINSGASITSVQKQLNHLSADTTAAYYARPDRHQTALLNRDYFNQSINSQEVKEEILFENINLYESEKEKSFIMDFGRCSRPEGPCGKGLLNQCVSCPKLLTSRDSLSRWKELLTGVKKEISLYEKCCIQMGISLSELEHFSEYLNLKELSHSYESLIRKVEEDETT